MKSLTGGQSIAQFYNYETDKDQIVLDCPQMPDEAHHPILWEEEEATLKALKMEKSAGVEISPSRRRSHDRHPDLNLQQDLEDRRMADHMNSIPSYHTLKVRQLAAVPELQNNQPHQPS